MGNNKGNKNTIRANIMAMRNFLKRGGFIAELINDIIFVVCAVAVFALFSQIVFGTYHPMVAVESGSMIPNMNIGDIVFIESITRTEIISQEEGMQIGYTRFDGYGDVILYRPYGRSDVTPIIHRAMYHVRKGESMYPENVTHWGGATIAPNDGYITKGDHNTLYDQETEISTVPVKDEWVIGVAKHKVPYLGYVRLTMESIIPN